MKNFPLLQMAAGEVRCGACGSVFNALDTLVDESKAALEDYVTRVQLLDFVV